MISVSFAETRLKVITKRCLLHLIKGYGYVAHGCSVEATGFAAILCPMMKCVFFSAYSSIEHYKTNDAHLLELHLKCIIITNAFIAIQNLCVTTHVCCSYFFFWRYCCTPKNTLQNKISGEKFQKKKETNPRSYSASRLKTIFIYWHLQPPRLRPTPFADDVNFFRQLPTDVSDIIITVWRVGFFRCFHVYESWIANMCVLLWHSFPEKRNSWESWDYPYKYILNRTHGKDDVCSQNDEWTPENDNINL